MDPTLRSAVALGAAAILVVPLVNALVLDARETVDRQVSSDDPPELQGPSPRPTENASRNISVSEPAAARLGGNCTPEPEDSPVAAWVHPAPSQDPAGATARRYQAPDLRDFRVADLHPALRVTLNVTDLAGSLSASVHPAGSPTETVFEVEANSLSGGDVDRGVTVTRAGNLTTGDWTARLDDDQAGYRELRFTVVRVLCQEGVG